MKRVLSLVFSAALALGLSPVAIPQAPVAWAADSSAPTLDGDIDEWANMPKQASTDGAISYWQVAKDADGNVYLAFTGNAVTQWYGDYQWKWFGISGGASNGYQINNLSEGDRVYNNTANGNAAGPYYVEARIPASNFGGKSDYTVSFAGTTVKASDIPTFKAAAVDPNANKRITIDGKFKDWDAIQKTDVKDPGAAEHGNNLAKEAMVFDGDYVYLYIEAGKGGDASGAGTHGNGQFAITTDLGRGNALLIHLKKDGTVTAGGRKIDDARRTGAQWEIAIPASMLPHYRETLNFGLYLEDPDITNVANLQGGKGNVGDFDGIKYDGDYSDWDAYPHDDIQYATPGTQRDVVDAMGALYSHDGTLYTHVKTEMPEHLGEKGGEFLQAVTYDFGDGRLLEPNFAEVDSDGTVHWYSGGTALSPGEHELYIFDGNDDYNNGKYSWHNTKDINQISDHDINYGKVTVTVGKDGKVDEMESEIDLKQVGKKFNCDASDFEQIKAQFGRLGQQWISYGGTPTGPWLGTAIAVGSVVVVVGGYALWRRRKQAR